MIPVICQTKHNPPHSYGDCVGACVASILELETVPHFYHDGDGERGFNRMRTWLAALGRIPAYFPLPGCMPIENALHAASMYQTEFLLFCQNRSGDHCVVGRDSKIVHDPAWYKTAITGPHSSGEWIVIILARVNG